jgi:hypothetical protein
MLGEMEHRGVIAIVTAAMIMVIAPPSSAHAQCST